MLGEDAVVIASTRAFHTFFGLDEQDLAGRHVGTLGQADGGDPAPGWAQWLHRALGHLPAGGKTVSPAIPVLAASTPGGPPHSRHVEVHLAHVELGPSAPACFTARIADVTEQLATLTEDARAKALLRSKAQLRQVKIAEAEARLESTRERLDAALQFAHVGTWELDFATGVIVCSDQCKANMGLAIDAAISESILLNEIVDPDDRAEVRERIGHAISRGTPYLAEYRLATVPGRWILAGGRVRLNPDRQPTGMVGFTLDITDRKQRELDQFALAVIDRAERESSERYARALDHFIASVSHELRTPIGVILNWAELLEIGGDRFDASNVAPVLKRNARHLKLMVEDLLDSGAIVSGNLTIRRLRIRLDTVIREIGSDFLGEAAKKGLTLRIADMPEILVDADEARLRQIFWNLLTNAIKFSEAGEISIEVGTSDGFVVCRVTDNGIGLEAADLEVIFERFKQLDTHGGMPSKGLGLGLWLVKNLVGQHGGSVSAESRGAGLGCTFVVKLPLPEDEPAFPRVP